MKIISKHMQIIKQHTKIMYNHMNIKYKTYEHHIKTYEHNINTYENHIHTCTLEKSFENQNTLAKSLETHMKTVYKTYGNELQGLEESTITLADVARNGLEGAQRNISVTYNNALPQKAKNLVDVEGSFSKRESTKRWENDTDVSACRICGRGFSFFTLRRHHCRRCGKIICNNCSPSKRLLNEVYTEDYPAGRTLKKPEKVRVCRNCEG